ncbi:hypothetical protein QH494_15955 [Sphingomonas sp. AR_OL41]|uniref:hypothetical protein n=1 Tax=Sphingomonas sp. AR_OL41 TaxID=3042729 RepID=UPI002481837E|nr:hypothetical protein [Sphingomonas sp. AR_OL41]MDH7973686.1 hypothetical protein [Sphingomonas sp. AR_OL41]
MVLRTGQPNFSKGVISEELVARIDVASYASGLKRADNVIVLKYGGVTKRPGTRLVAEVYADQGVRLIPFQFSLEQTYALEMGQGYMRPAANGGLVIEEKLTITAITPGVTTTIAAAYHAYSIGDQVYFDGVTGMAEINGRIGRVTSVPDAGHYVVDIDSTGFSAFTGDTGGITRSGTPPPPPPPPPVPPPAPDPTPPPVGGGGGGGRYCVADDTPILLADGREVQARFLTIGTLLRTRHEATLDWGDYPIEDIKFAFEPVWRGEVDDVEIRATPDHRFFVAGGWMPMREIGRPDGKAWVAKITVAEAHTYVSAGVLSHNFKEYDNFL